MIGTPLAVTFPGTEYEPVRGLVDMVLVIRRRRPDVIEVHQQPRLAILLSLLFWQTRVLLFLHNDPLIMRGLRRRFRIASSRNAPERTGHCLTRMLPSARHIVNRVAQNPAFLFDRRTCFPVPTWRRPSRGAQRRGLGGAEPPGATRSAPLRASMARMASTGPSPK